MQLRSIRPFCNLCFPRFQVNGGLIAIATPRQIQEMDISLLLKGPSWLEDECEYNLSIKYLSTLLRAKVVCFIFRIAQ